jgi:Flp pilus assembly protein TadB
MFDWFAARPPRSGESEQDRPTIPLTQDERMVFAELSRQAAARRSPVGSPRFGVWWASIRGVVAGAALVVAGGLWCLVWLTASVPVSFVGVLVQALGMILGLESRRLRRSRAGSAAPLAASPAQPDARRRQGT